MTPRWANWKTVVGAIALALGGWVFFAARDAPACNELSLRERLELRLILLEVIPKSDPAQSEHRRRLTNIEEAGYIEAERTRGCLAVWRVGDASSPVAYEVVPYDKTSGFTVNFRQPALVRAYYGQVDAEGVMPALGQPIGDIQLKQAVAAYLAKLDASPRLPKREPPREYVNSLVPVGDCARRRRNEYACELVIEYYDRLSDRVDGQGYQILQGEFHFVQDNSVWRVADGFPKQFAAAQSKYASPARKRVEAMADKVRERRKEVEALPEPPWWGNEPFPD